MEEVFYLFFPIVCRVLGRSKLLFAVLLGLVALGPLARTVFAHGNEIWEEYSYLGGTEGIALGCLTALMISRIRFSRAAILALGGGGSAIVGISLIFSWQAYVGWPGRTGLNMTILAVGTCMFIAATAQTRWRSPSLLAPLLKIGQYSYEVYLTHMFVVFGFFGLFLQAGGQMRLVPVLFVATILVAGLMGAAVSALYSEPMNRFLRRAAGSDHGRLAPASEIAPK